MQDLASFAEIYEAVQYIDTLFDLLPKGRADFCSNRQNLQAKYKERYYVYERTQ